MMMKFHEVLACLLLPVLLPNVTAIMVSRGRCRSFARCRSATYSGLFSEICFRRICLSSTQRAAAGEQPNVSRIDLDSINALLYFYPEPEGGGGFYCSDLDVSKFAKLIRFNCSLGFPDNGTCRVTYIDFSNMDLGGTFSPNIGNLTHLRYLDLSGNRLSGSIPTSLVQLTKLSFVDLSGNLLDGPVPHFNVNNTKLLTLNLCSNLLTGTIPKEFGGLPSLENLHLCFNLLNGTVPDELCNIGSLISLRFEENYLEGPIPEKLGNLANLKEIVLMNNDFNGTLPGSIAELKNLVFLRLQGSNFNGRISEVIAGLQSLKTLWLIGNNFTGLPKAFSSSNLSEIIITDLYPNERGNPFPNLTNLVNLQSLTLRNCSLTGQIPHEIWGLPRLVYLDLSLNKLTGKIPPSLENSTYLGTIYLGSNKLNGLLPGWASNSTKVAVDVSDNLFITNNAIFPNATADKNLFSCCNNNATDDDAKRNWLDIKYSCANETSTRDHLFINCGGNAASIDSSDYEADLDEDGSSTFFLSNSSAWGYSSIGSFETTSTKRRYIVNRTCDISLVDGPLYTEARVAPISLKYYGFCLRNGNYTVRLHFAEIGWDEARVRSKGRGRRLFNVEIQGKKELEDFSIEEAAGGLYKNATMEFNTSVTTNRLEIHLYWSGKGSMFVPRQYGPLISAISVSAVPKKHPKNLSPGIIGAIVGSSFIFVALILAVLWMLGWLGGKKPKKDGMELYPGVVFNFQDIKDATNNFDQENLIGGAGAFYKGKLKGKTEGKLSAESKQGAIQIKDETESAVKKLSAESTQGAILIKDETEIAEKNLSAESRQGAIQIKDETEIAVKKVSAGSRQGAIQILGEILLLYTLEHPNIAKPLGSCAKDREVLIVYEYMESLQHALFDSNSSDDESKLNWKRRSKICLDIAKGLKFLHEEAEIDIIHCNIKPTNILLDKDFNVKMSDFIYSKAKPHDEQMNKQETIFGNMPRAKDTGHMAPEYMLGLPLTPKADVYSFGLVMLEIISGQPYIITKPKESIQLINTAYQEYANGTPDALIDRNLKKEFKYNEAVSMLNLAMLCLSPSFALRPTVSEVVEILEGKKKLTRKPFNPLAMVVPVMSPSQSTESGSGSQEGASSANISESHNLKMEGSIISDD